MTNFYPQLHTGYPKSLETVQYFENNVLWKKMVKIYGIQLVIF